MRADRIENKPVEWLWKERIPVGMITVIAGPPGGSKSLLGARIAADISKKGVVMLSCAEDPKPQMIGPRLTANGARKKRIIVDYEPNLPDDYEEFADLVIKNRIKLCILDPINEHLSPGVRRHNDSIRKITKPLKKLAEQTGCAMVLIDHTIKAPAPRSHPIAAIGGASSGLAAAARMAYIVGRDPDDGDRLVMCPAKSNLREEPMAFDFTMDNVDVENFGDMAVLIDGGECEFDPMSFFTRAKGKKGRPPSKREAALEWLIEYLRAAPSNEGRANEIIEDAKQYAITKRTLDNAKKDAEVTSEKRNNEWWWKLPPELVQDG